MDPFLPLLYYFFCTNFFISLRLWYFLIPNRNCLIHIPFLVLLHASCIDNSFCVIVSNFYIVWSIMTLTSKAPYIFLCNNIFLHLINENICYLCFSIIWFDGILILYLWLLDILHELFEVVELKILSFWGVWVLSLQEKGPTNISLQPKLNGAREDKKYHKMSNFAFLILGKNTVWGFHFSMTVICCHKR